jgi:hypothetical protein
MQTIEFDYQDVNGRELNIMAYVENGQIYFTTYLFDKIIPNSSLTTLDFANIQTYVLKNAEDDIEYESDFYDRSSD